MDKPGCERIGLGCASLFGLPTRAARQRLLAAAYDAGIKHFDVAPIYGLGLAESELGEFLQSRPDCTVTTKFGLRPTAAGRVAGLVQPPVRKLLQRSSAAKSALKTSGANPETGVVGRILYVRQPLDVAHLRLSLSLSQKSLRRDMLDIWLLHDPIGLHEGVADAITEFLDSERDRGTIGAWGVAGDIAADPSVAAMAARGQVVQYPYDLWRGNQFLAGSDSQVQRYSYGFLSRAAGSTRRILDADPDLTRSCSDLLGADVSTEAVLVGFLARDAVRANPDGKVLYSTTSETHLLEVLDEIDRPDCDPARDDEVARLLRDRMEGTAS